MLAVWRSCVLVVSRYSDIVVVCSCVIELLWCVVVVMLFMLVGSSALVCALVRVCVLLCVLVCSCLLLCALVCSCVLLCGIGLRIFLCVLVS